MASSSGTGAAESQWRELRGDPDCPNDCERETPADLPVAAPACGICGKPLDAPGELHCSAGHPLPVAAPYPASVSPADTSEAMSRARRVLAGTGTKTGRYTKRALARDVIALGDALLAVGERDKAERERDRQRIAELTDALRRITWLDISHQPQNLSPAEKKARCFDFARDIARAVLAVEEEGDG